MPLLLGVRPQPAASLPRAVGRQRDGQTKDLSQSWPLVARRFLRLREPQPATIDNDLINRAIQDNKRSPWASVVAHGACFARGCETGDGVSRNMSSTILRSRRELVPEQVCATRACDTSRDFDEQRDRWRARSDDAASCDRRHRAGRAKVDSSAAWTTFLCSSTSQRHRRSSGSTTGSRRCGLSETAHRAPSFFFRTV